MANYQQLKQSIANVIKTNGNKAITGAILQNVLKTILSSIGANYTFGGVAETTASPGTPDANIFWLAGAGTYVNMGNITIPANHIGVIMWNGSWSSSSLPVAKFASGEYVGNVTLSSTVGNNDNLVRGRGIYSALQGKQDKINDLATIRTNAEAGAEAKTMATEIRKHVDGFIVITEMDNVADFVDKVRLTSRYAVLNAQTSTETNSVVVGILDMFGQDSKKFVLTQVYTTSQTMTGGVLDNAFSYGKTYQYVRYKARNASGATQLNQALGTSIAAGEWTGWYNLHEGVEIVNDLTTGGTQAALSAEMGKSLNTSLTLLQTAVNGISDNLAETSKTLDKQFAEVKTMATEIRNHVDGFIVITEMDNVADFVDKVRLTSRYAVLNAQTSTETNSVIVGILDVFGQDSAKFVLTQVYTTSQTMTDGVLNNAFRYGKTYQYVRYKARNASGASSLNAALGTSIAAGEWTGWYNLHEGGGGSVDIVNDLTTGGTQVALSAEMGKSLNASLKLLQTAVNGIADNLGANTDKDGQHNVAEFGGFIETNITVEMTSPVALVNPSNVLFSTARNLFVARIGLRYYQSWTGSGVGSSDYQSGAEPHAGKVFTCNGKTYQYNPATSQLVNVGVEVVEVDWSIPTTAAYADISNSAEAYQVAKGQAILQRVRRLISYGNNIEVRLPITSGYARHFEILNETDNLTICWLVRCAERLVQARLLPTGRMVVEEQVNINEKEDKVAIITAVNDTDATQPLTSLTCETGKYYKVEVAVETIDIILPAITNNSNVQTVVLFLTAGTTPAVTFTSQNGANILYHEGYGIESGKTYEINCLWNGSAWVIASLEIVKP